MGMVTVIHESLDLTKKTQGPIKLQQEGKALVGLNCKVSGVTVASSGVAAEDGIMQLLQKLHLWVPGRRKDIWGYLSGQQLMHMADHLWHQAHAVETVLPAGGGAFEQDVFFPIIIPKLTEPYGEDALSAASDYRLETTNGAITDIYSSGGTSITSATMQIVGIWEDLTPQRHMQDYRAFTPVFNIASPYKIDAATRIRRIWFLVKSSTPALADNLTKMYVERPVSKPFLQFDSGPQLKRFSKQRYQLGQTGIYVLDFNPSGIARLDVPPTNDDYVLNFTKANSTDTVDAVIETIEVL